MNVQLGAMEISTTILRKQSTPSSDCAILSLANIPLNDTIEVPQFARPNVSELVFNTQRQVQGQVRFLRFRYDVNTTHVTHHFLVRPIQGEDFCNGQDAGALIVRQQDKKTVLGMISACFLEGPLKGSAIAVYWDYIERDCDVTLQQSAILNKKDEL